MKNQETLFTKTEGDHYYARNKSLYVQDDWGHDDPALRIIARHRLRPRRVLEIGCSNGWRLHKIQKAYHSLCVGVDPSRSAIQDGKKRYPAISFKQATADRLGLDKQPPFDLVIVYFVLHWVSRPLLLKALGEIDRMVKSGEHLLIGDFLPGKPTRVPYHHVIDPAVYTFKTDYSAMFTATGLYKAQEQFIFDHRTHQKSPSIPSGQRAQCALLLKSEMNFYTPAQRPLQRR